MNGPKVIRPRTNRPTALSNLTCPYCGLKLTKRQVTKDHVIGRRFVPLGSLSASWNLILQSCEPCNNKKSDLEDDISAITMAFHTHGLPGMDDETLIKETARKSQRTVSRKTGKPLSDSTETVSFNSTGRGGLSISANFTAPPQLDDTRTLALARLQMMGFFYFLTYDTSTSHGHWWRGSFQMLNGALKSDWGNPIQKAFASEIANWDYRLIGTFATGYLQVVIRKHPTSDCWAWAMEWNYSYRIMGFFGDEETVATITDKMPPLVTYTLAESQNSHFRYREEVSLSEDNDILFRILE